MSCATNRPVGGDKLTEFLQQTLGALAEGYVVSLAELSSLKEPRHQKELLNLKEDLKAKDKALFCVEEQLRKKDNELVVLRKKLKTVEADLMLSNTKNRKMQSDTNRLLELEAQADKRLPAELHAEFKKINTKKGVKKKTKAMNTSVQPAPMSEKQCWNCHHVSFTKSPSCGKCGMWY